MEGTQQNQTDREKSYSKNSTVTAVITSKPQTTRHHDDKLDEQSKTMSLKQKMKNLTCTLRRIKNKLH